MNNAIDTVLESLNEICDLNVLHYSQTSEGHGNFYLLEQSSLQVLRILHLDTPVEVKHIFSERHRIYQQIESIKKVTSVKGFLDMAIPLVQNGNFACKDLTLIINSHIELKSHDDGEVHLTSGKAAQLLDVMKKILTFEGYDPNLLTEIMNRPNIYHKLERPDKILSSYQTFDELIDSF